ncbi:hypothetical protein [Desulfovibrio sp. UCD-KL4C]|uniref:hypothetical protein n=1 Tax=Desulfovibrio sp. UCD-KL4C TaxID=2578120 RepID=UPI0025BE42C6|nr:hypothetical protein [Desulfovibrio sp. UCD-KL4C]
MPEKTLALAHLYQQGGDYILPALLGLIGGIIRIIQKDGPCTWFGRLAALATAAFTGTVFYKLMVAAGVPGGYAAPITTIVGYIGRPLLDILSARICTIAKTVK